MYISKPYNILFNRIKQSGVPFSLWLNTLDGLWHVTLNPIGTEIHESGADPYSAMHRALETFERDCPPARVTENLTSAVPTFVVVSPIPPVADTPPAVDKLHAYLVQVSGTQFTTTEVAWLEALTEYVLGAEPGV